jgi:hypothetical protein
MVAPSPSETEKQENMDVAQRGDSSSTPSSDARQLEEERPNQYEEPGLQLEPGEEGTDEVDKYLLMGADEPTTRLQKSLRHCAILSLLAFTAIWGTLAREGLIALNTYSGMSIEPSIWAQSFGCLVMGWTVANRKALEKW